VSKSFCSARLTRPIFGLPSRIQATVNRIPGMMSGMIESAKNSDLNGVLVRSFIQASSVPSAKASSDAPAANLIELQKRSQVSSDA
jgi:hypothetical protein